MSHGGRSQSVSCPVFSHGAQSDGLALGGGQRHVMSARLESSGGAAAAAAVSLRECVRLRCRVGRLPPPTCAVFGARLSGWLGPVWTQMGVAVLRVLEPPESVMKVMSAAGSVDSASGSTDSDASWNSDVSVFVRKCLHGRPRDCAFNSHLSIIDSFCLA